MKNPLIREKSLRLNPSRLQDCNASSRMSFLQMLIKIWASPKASYKNNTLTMVRTLINQVQGEIADSNGHAPLAGFGNLPIDKLLNSSKGLSESCLDM